MPFVNQNKTKPQKKLQKTSPPKKESYNLIKESYHLIQTNFHKIN